MENNQSQKSDKSRILIVDDSLVNIKVVENILKLNGYDYLSATDGHLVEGLIKENQFDLVLLDIFMPDIDGFEICRMLKENPKSNTIPVIFLTANIKTEDLVKGFQCGGVDYIKKPYDSNELLARVATHIELKKSRDLIEAQKNELEELNRLKNKFFSVVTHDIKSPLTSILTFSDYLKLNLEDFTKDELVSYIEQFSGSVHHLYKLIENLIEWSNIQTGQVEINVQRVALLEIIEGIVLEMQPVTEQKKIALFNRIPNKVQILADENKLKFILGNILDNAVKFSNLGGEVIIDGTQKGDFYEISIKDNGIGMSESFKSRLYQLDSYASHPGTADEKGTGLGLMICRDFLKRMGGDIRIESYEKIGTTFYLIFKISGY